MSPDLDKHMDMLERRANVVRSRLLRTVDALDVRRHQVATLGTKAKAAVPKIGALLFAIASASAGAVLGLRHWFRRRRGNLLVVRARRLFDQLRIERQPSTGALIVQRVTLTVVTMVATEVSRRAMKNFIDGRHPDGRLAAGRSLEAHHERSKG